MTPPLATPAAIAPAPGTVGLPPVNQALEPASVRNGTPATQKAYASALDFEHMLVQQLSQSLTQASGLGEGGGETEGGGEAADSELSTLLPQALTEGVMHQGGLGLAQQMVPALALPTSVKVASNGGVAA